MKEMNKDIPLEVVFKCLLRDYKKALDELWELKEQQQGHSLYNQLKHENKILRKKLKEYDKRSAD